MDTQQTRAEGSRFGRYLRRIREERRLSLDAVEEMSLGLPERVTKSHLSRIENGQAVPTFPRMFTLSQIYGVPVTSLAERFELCLRAQMLPPAAATRSFEDVSQDARKLCMSGQHAEALLLYESLLDRIAELQPMEARRWTIDLRLNSINCLKKLSRLATAKEECEKLLTLTDLNPTQEVLALQYFAMCCHRLGKYTVALMAIEKAEEKVSTLPDPRANAAMIAMLKGNLHSSAGRYDEAAAGFRTARTIYQQLSDPFESCRAQINLGAALIELGKTSEASRLLNEALNAAEHGSYDLLRTLCLSHLALIAYRRGDIETAEAYCLRSNLLARPREYVSILFRNCFYLWRIAQARGDDPAARANERTLRTYLNRVEPDVAEAAEFRATLGGGSHA